MQADGQTFSQADGQHCAIKAVSCIFQNVICGRGYVCQMQCSRPCCRPVCVPLIIDFTGALCYISIVLFVYSFIHSFIHSGYVYSASSSPLGLLLRGVPDTARILCRNFTPKRQRKLWVKVLPKVPTRRLERESSP